MEMSPKNITR